MFMSARRLLREGLRAHRRKLSRRLYSGSVGTRTATSMRCGFASSGFSQADQKTHQSIVVSPISSTSRRTQFI
jgi:hypothetical protein